MDLMNQVCRPYLDKFVIVFIDDIFIYSRRNEEHEEHLRQLSELLKNNELKAWSLIWEEKEEAAFQLLKQKLYSAPILALHEGSENFMVYCDASHKGLGVVLMQKEKFIAYTSRQLKAKGVADALSRKERIKPLRVWALVMTIGLNLLKQILNAQAEARKEGNFMTKDICGMINKLEPYVDGMLCSKNQNWILCFGNLRALIMHESHTSKYSIHPGSDKDVPRLEEVVLVAHQESRHSHLFEQVLDAHKDEGRLPETIRFTGTTRNTPLEMRKYSHEFYHQSAKDNKLLLHDLGNRDHQKNYAEVRRKPLEF
ncbi:putative reverse transcriptase domain-containing protein [Tanacetum coccineum]